MRWRTGYRLAVPTAALILAMASASPADDRPDDRAEAAAARAERAAERSEAAAGRVDAAVGRLERILERLERQQSTRRRSAAPQANSPAR